MPQHLVNRAIGQWCRILGCIVQQQGRHIKHLTLKDNWDNKRVVSVVNFLKCVVAEVVLFLMVILKTLIFYKVV